MNDIYADGRYLKHTRTWHEEDSPFKAAQVEKAIQRTGTRFSTCVDIGCGAGLIAELVAKNHPDCKVFGYDVSPDASEFWAGRTGVTYRQENLLESSERFDLALCLDVFEHVEDYIGFLRTLRKSAGRFIFNVPLDMSIAKLMRGLKPDRENLGHLHYFNSYTALATLELAGYKIVDSFFVPGFMARRPANLREALVYAPRWALRALGPGIAATLVGAYSLVVTADS